VKPLVKICGITRLEDARYASAAGADLLGFIQYPESPRYIPPAQAKEIIEWVYGSKSVGVFVNASADEVNRVAEQAGFDYVQLHGTESPEFLPLIERPVIKAIRVMHDASSEQIRNALQPYAEHAEYLLLDTHSTSLWGGTGESFNWRLARELSGYFPLILAGGISAANVEEALLTMRPTGIDLSSSLEEAPGLKDFDKMGAFFDAFHEACERLESLT